MSKMPKVAYMTVGSTKDGEERCFYNKTLEQAEDNLELLVYGWVYRVENTTTV